MSTAAPPTRGESARPAALRPPAAPPARAAERPSAARAVTRTIAVDWSGARTGAERKIWLCEVRDGRVVRLEHGRSREALVAHVITEAARDPRLVVGLDFAFSFPAWFVAGHGGSAPALWRNALRDGERWARAEVPPFWGRPGVKRDPTIAEHRRTEREIAARTGMTPKSVFQVGGAGAVGTGSIRGMPCLAHLQDAGFAIWPFDAPRAGAPVAVEIWPRLCYAEPVVKARATERAAWVRRHAPALGAPQRAAATESDDAFDALAAGLALWRARETLAAMPGARDEEEALEGRIWEP